jgi:hypothetical protein
MENDVRSTLQALSLGQYIDVLQKNGFSDLVTLSKAREEDFSRLGFKLGHRRRLQRELASMSGLPPWEPLESGDSTEQGASMSADTSSTHSSSLSPTPSAQSAHIPQLLKVDSHKGVASQYEQGLGTCMPVNQTFSGTEKAGSFGELQRVRTIAIRN